MSKVNNTNDQFVFFCVNVGNEQLLKEEIKRYYPELALSYSRKGFITFKNKGVRFDLETISQLQLTFATRSGLCLGKSSPDRIQIAVKDKIGELGLLLDDCMIHSYKINTEYEFDPYIEFGDSINQYSANGKLVLNIITLSENEIWFGLHRVAKGITRFPNAKVKITVPDCSPSIAYRKLAEISELYALKLKPYYSWLDFGCAPGGSALYLLDTGAKVCGIDTADVDESILSHKNFDFIKSSVQDLSQENLPDENIDWVHVDININPKQAVKEVLRLCKKYQNSLKGIVFTVQIIRLDLIQNIEDFEDIFYEWGFSTIISCQVPSHKKEYVIIAQRIVRE